MDKQAIVKSLAIHFGLKQEYLDSNGYLQQVSYNDCENFLKSIGIDTESSQNLESILVSIEYNHWNNKLDNVQVIKESEYPVIKVNVNQDELNKKLKWQLEEENGSVHSDEFFVSNLSIAGYKHFENKGTFYQFELPLSITPEIGYHSLSIWQNDNQLISMRLIVTPSVCYSPPHLKNTKEIFGPKISLHTVTPENEIRIADSRELNYIISNLAKEKGGIVGIGAINQVAVRSGNINAYVPSSRFLLNTLYLNLDYISEFIEDRSVETKSKIAEYYEEVKKIVKANKSNYRQLYKEKITVLKSLYQSYRENHINLNSKLADVFWSYVNRRGERFLKLALFRALEEYLTSQDPSLESWHDWPEAYKNPQSDVVKQFEKSNIEQIQFYQFCQWQADIQLEEAGKLSFNNGLDVGIYTELPFCIDRFGGDTWCNQEFFSIEANVIKSTSSGDKLVEAPPVIPRRLVEDNYNYLIDYLKSNMIHSGALKIENLAGFEISKWSVKTEEEENIYYVNYPLEDILGIIALESTRNKCMIFSDNPEELPPKLKQIAFKYGLYSESDFNLEEIKDLEGYRKYFEKTDESIKESIQKIDIFKIPKSTYRLQLNKDFTFNDARNLIPYLKKLGISHCYISPVFKARSNSTHGYDIIDHSDFHPSIGTKQDFYEFSDELHRNNMGLIIDIVPNHVGINSENKWWMDILENGSSSLYANHFDIDWHPIKKELHNKVLLPILGDHYGYVLENGLFDLRLNKSNGKLTLHYYDHIMPINPSSYPLILNHRIDVLASRIGSSNIDYLEYRSIITEFNNLPVFDENTQDKIEERQREKEIAYNRLKNLVEKNTTVEEFISENLLEFKAKENDPVSWNLLHNLLEEQAYRLAYWRVSVDEINYRRFFDVNDLAAICVENPTVFTATHNFILELIKHGKVDGLRIDHPDGLLDPTSYFKTLQLEAAKRLNLEISENEDLSLSSEKLPIYISAEKILAPFEKLNNEWAIHGTVGYEYLNSLNGLFIKRENEKKFTSIYNRFTNTKLDFQELVIKCKKIIMRTTLTAELSVLSNYLNRISENYFISRDFTLNNIRNALVEVIAHFPVYRTYITTLEVSDKCSDYIKWAVRAAQKHNHSMEPSIFEFIEKVLLLEFEKDTESDLFNEILKFTMKLQQYTGPLMAKGMEDTSFYRYNRLVSLNEVGGEPNHFGVLISDFNQQSIERLESTPYNMLSTSTHDTKRSEDVRARISVLSELPEVWQKKVNKWSQLNRSKKTKSENSLMPDKNDEYLFYQTLLGIWPYEIKNNEEIDELSQRLEEYMLKAIREAKLHTSWININNEYEDAVKNFIKKVIVSYNKHPFWREFLPFQKHVARLGYINSISQTIIKFTSPGIPDIYQGNETLSFRFVDPDNRKNVDYCVIENMLDEIFYVVEQGVEKSELPESLENKLLDYQNGYAKLFVTSSLLKFRNDKTSLVLHGEYIPLEVNGNNSENIIAYARKHKNETFLTIAPRFLNNLMLESSNLPASDNWLNTCIKLPSNFNNKKWKNYLTGELYDFDDIIKISEIFTKFPVALLIIQD